jgi:hypothetical protein
VGKYDSAGFVNELPGGLAVSHDSAMPADGTQGAMAGEHGGGLGSAIVTNPYGSSQTGQPVGTVGFDSVQAASDPMRDGVSKVQQVNSTTGGGSSHANHNPHPNSGA